MSYPNFKDKHKEEPLFTPHSFFKYKKIKVRNFPKKWVVTWQSTIIKHLKRKYHVKAKDFDLGEDTYIVNGVGVINLSGIGSPHAVATLEEMVAMGGKEFITVGISGGLRDQGIFLCDKALRDEGTSYHYLPHGKYSYPDKSLTSRFAKSLEKSKLDYEMGSTWTIDAPYMETKSEVKKYKKLGIATVEMEASALFALATVRKVKIAGAFMVSDVLGDEEWKPKFDSRHMKSLLNKLADSAVECLR
tara:strand:- start:1052 stop:1789 length:738 start_codon:yes stop_codon:yes gene_type:complete